MPSDYFIGDKSAAQVIITNEIRLAILEKLVEKLSQFAPPGACTQEFYKQTAEEAEKEVRAKYSKAIV